MEVTGTMNIIESGGGPSRQIEREHDGGRRA
jgi:hypothetical protein